MLIRPDFRQSIYAFQAAYSGLNLNQDKAEQIYLVLQHRSKSFSLSWAADSTDSTEQTFVDALASYKIVLFELRRANAVSVQI